MTLPRIHSYTWSDRENGTPERSPAKEASPDDPLGLQDTELHLWVTYPEKKNKGSRRKRKGAKSSKKPKLWAVVIIEALAKLDDFTYEVTMKRICKKDERTIKTWVQNNPAEQSEDAVVFEIISPAAGRLDPLEQRLSMWTAKRVYDAIADTWPEGFR
jgi:hypothetical protein